MVVPAVLVASTTDQNSTAWKRRADNCMPSRPAKMVSRMAELAT